MYVPMPVTRRRAMRPSTSTSGRSPSSSGMPDAGSRADADDRAFASALEDHRRGRRVLMREVTSTGSGMLADIAGHHAGAARPGSRRVRASRGAERPGHAAADAGNPTIDAAREP